MKIKHTNPRRPGVFVTEHELNKMRKLKEISRAASAKFNAQYEQLKRERDVVWVTERKEMCRLVEKYKLSYFDVPNKLRQQNDTKPSVIPHIGFYYLTTKGEFVYEGILERPDWSVDRL